MRRLLVFIIMLAIPSIVSGQQVIDLFDAEPDSGYWVFENVASSDTTNITIGYSAEQVAQGPSAMKIDWIVQASEGFGGFTNMMHLSEDSTLFDFSLGTHLSLWYYNAIPSSRAGDVEFRILLKEVSDAPIDLSAENITDAEFWYSHAFILDSDPGWNQLLLPLENAGSFTDQQGLWLPGWAGAGGNGELNLDKIRAFKYEFSITGASHDPTNPQASGVSNGSIFVDNFRVVGHRNPVINLFDTTATQETSSAGTGSSNIVVMDNVADAFEDVSAQFDWTVEATESFGGFASLTFESDTFLVDMSPHSHLSLRYNNLVASDMPGNVIMRVQLHDFSEGDDQEEFWYYETNVVLDAEPGWNQLLIPLEDRGQVPPTNEGFSQPGWAGVAGNSKLDFDKIKLYEIAFSAFQQGTTSKGSVAFDNLELYGFKETDFEAPAAPEGVSAVPDAANFFNLVIWQDVAGETDETYTVYASREPITDVNANGVEVVASGIARGTNTAVHRLTYPLVDTQVSYYYAVTATDKAGNTSEAGVSPGATSGTAKGIATISLNPPANFAADGDITEWENSGIMPFVLRPSDSHIAVGAVDSDDDLTATIYLAVDADYLYIGADVIDDVFSYDPGGDWWEDDAIELFIGFYDQRGAQHAGFERGAQPDYQISLRKNIAVNGRNGDQQLYVDTDADYYFEGLGTSDYILETRIPLDSIAFGDDVKLQPMNGMRVPMDLLVHDSDATNTRDGGVSFSPNNNDNSFQSPRNWTFTWIGDQAEITTSVADEPGLLPTDYALNQNYPNPFNPSTTIQYALKQAGPVKLVLFNALGQQVRVLVDGLQPEGTFSVQLDGTDLSSGVYFYQLQTPGFNQVRKMLLMK